MQTISDDIDFLKFLGKQESQYVIKPSDVVDDVLAEFRKKPEEQGDFLPWSKTHAYFCMRPGEVTIWGGYNGHKKSMVTTQVCAWALRQSRWLIASLEMKYTKTLKRMLKQAVGCDIPSDEYATRFLKWTDDRLWLYDQTDTVKADRILGMVHYAAQELKINHIIIDSLMKCGIAKDDMDGQARFVDRLCWAAKSENIHIHLIHHMRKHEKGEFFPPGKHDFRGAGEVVDLVDNAIAVHCNKKKEQLRNEGKEFNEDEADITLDVVKQRNGEYEGKFKFWFNEKSLQLTPDVHNRVMPYEF